MPDYFVVFKFFFVGDADPEVVYDEEFVCSEFVYVFIVAEFSDYVHVVEHFWVYGVVVFLEVSFDAVVVDSVFGEVFVVVFAEVFEPLVEEFYDVCFSCSYAADDCYSGSVSDGYGDVFAVFYECCFYFCVFFLSVPGFEWLEVG